VFGLKSSLRNSLAYLEDGSYVYPAGATVVITSSDGKSQRFVPGSIECEGISALCLSPNKRLLAVAERADKAVICVYDLQTLKRRKQLVAADVGAKVCVRFAALSAHAHARHDAHLCHQQLACASNTHTRAHPSTGVCQPVLQP
jgi:hypothetical protein